MEVCSRYVASNLYDIKRFYIFATRNSAINEMRFFSLLVFRMCSRLAVTAALLGRWLPALNPTSGSSPSGSSDKLRATVPSGPAIHLCVTCALSGTSPVERFGFTVDGESDTYRKRDPVYSRDEVGRFSSTLAALLRVTGFTAERLNHSLYTSALPLLDIPPPHVSSVKWKSCPIKKRQPGADHGRTYANVDTVKYHTRRGGKISLRGKQIG